MTVRKDKAEMRQRAFAMRAAAHGAVDPDPALQVVEAWLGARDGIATVSAYAAIRTELDPAPLLTRLHGRGIGLCLPVVIGPDQPLEFRAWVPGQALIAGAFGAAIPPEGPPVRPDAVVAPLLAFDMRGYRLGYGGGYYDRTLLQLRQDGPVPAIGLAYAAQAVARVPTEPTDVALDAIATETGLARP